MCSFVMQGYTLAADLDHCSLTDYLLHEEYKNLLHEEYKMSHFQGGQHVSCM